VSRLAKEEQRKGTSSWRTLWLNSMKSGVAGLEVEQPSFDCVQLANHISTTHDDVRLPGIFSAGESLRVGEQ